MSFSQQYWLLATLPAFILTLLFFFWRFRLEDKWATIWWSLALLCLAIGSSGVLSHFSGVSLTVMQTVYWRVVSRYAMLIAGIKSLLTAFRVWGGRRGVTRRSIWLSLAVGLIALLLDGTLWGEWLAPRAFMFGDRRLWWRQFDSWGVALTLGWLLPAGLALLGSLRLWGTSSSSRRQKRLLWLLIGQCLLLAGGCLTLAHLPHQLAWGQLGAGLLAVGGLAATLGLRPVYQKGDGLPPPLEASWLGETEPLRLAAGLTAYLETEFDAPGPWLFVVEDVMGGRLLLRPLPANKREPAIFAHNSPFAAYLRQQSQPLTQNEIDSSPQFAGMDSLERALLTAWKREIYVPLRVNNRLVGLIALRGKRDGAPFLPAEIERLRHIGAYAAPQLAQAGSAAALKRAADDALNRVAQSGAAAIHYRALAQFQGSFISWLNGDSADEIGMAEAKRVAAKMPAVVDELFQQLHIEIVLQRIIRRLSAMAHGRRVIVDCRCPDNFPAIMGNEQQLVEAFTQLLHNAIQFNRIGGWVRVNCLLEDDGIVVQISDSGVGMSPEHLAALWRPLSEMPAHDGADAGNLKMGLLKAQTIIQGHGGGIIAESEYGEGSVFTIWLPAAPP